MVKSWVLRHGPFLIKLVFVNFKIPPKNDGIYLRESMRASVITLCEFMCSSLRVTAIIMHKLVHERDHHETLFEISSECLNYQVAPPKHCFSSYSDVVALSVTLLVLLTALPCPYQQLAGIVWIDFCSRNSSYSHAARFSNVLAFSAKFCAYLRV